MSSNITDNQEFPIKDDVKVIINQRSESEIIDELIKQHVKLAERL